MAARANPHGEAHLDPANYTFVGWFDNHPDFGFSSREFFKEELARLRKQREELIARSTSAFGKVGQCAHCGNGIRYHVLIEDTRDGALLAIGEDCASNRFELSTREWAARKAELDAMRERARAGEKRIKLRNTYPEAVEILETALAERAQLHEDLMECEDEDGRAALWRIWRDTAPPTFILDVADKMVQYGDLSERQAAAVVKVHRETEERRAQREAEQEAAGPVPEGNGLEIEGEVLTTKYQDSMYGSTLKMLVKADDGWKVWGTVPNALPLEVDFPVEERASATCLRRGARVRFVANVERSRDDESFGFFKRPRKAEILETAGAETGR